jgi:hypothetical protein
MGFRIGVYGACLGVALTSSLVLGQQNSPTPAKRSSGATTTQQKTEPTLAAKPGTGPATPADKPTTSQTAPQPPQKAKTTVISAKRAPTPAASSGEQYLLRYNLRPKTKIVSEVTHLAKTNTKVNDVEQSSQSRTVSRKVWTVTEVASNGDMTFVHQVDSVDMSQKIGDGEEIHYNSKTETQPLEIFAKVAETIGKPIATVTITPSGQVVNRSEEAQGSNLGMGDITIPMPDQAIQIGDQWETSREIRIRRPDGTPKSVKVRELYTLEKVSAGVASISIRSEPLTPLTEPEVEAQVLQQISNGQIRFDLDSGRLISKNLTWDKTVVGFSGTGSVMDYSARLDEVVEK